MYLSQLAAELKTEQCLAFSIEEQTNGEKIAILSFSKEGNEPLIEKTQLLNPTDKMECSRLIDFLAQRMFSRIS